MLRITFSVPFAGISCQKSAVRLQAELLFYELTH